MLDARNDQLVHVNRVQRFSLADGPGIRTTVFCQGCNLRCWWCHNPEAQPDAADEAMMFTPRDLVDQLLRDERYWQASGGGVTFSGGEPLRQPVALRACLERLGAAGVHRAVDTAGDVAAQAVRTVAAHVDLWLWDVKTADERVFAEQAGGDLDRVLANLRWVLASADTRVRVRIPVIAGVNDAPGEVDALVGLVRSLPRPVEVELLAGHDLGRANTERGAAVGARRFAEIHDRCRNAGVIPG